MCYQQTTLKNLSGNILCLNNNNAHTHSPPLIRFIFYFLNILLLKIYMHNAHILLEIHTISLTDSLLLLQKKASSLLLYLWAMLMDVKEDWNILNQRRPVTTNQDMDATVFENWFQDFLPIWMSMMMVLENLTNHLQLHLANKTLLNSNGQKISLVTNQC